MVDTHDPLTWDRGPAWLLLAERYDQAFSIGQHLPAVAKHKLDFDFDPEITVIGISSHVHDYRLCWSLNRNAGLDLTRRRTDICDEGNGIVARYSVYDQVDEDSQARVTLVNNHSADGILLKEQRHTDFFLVVDDELAEMNPDLLDRVRAAEFVLTAFPLPYEQLRSGYKLLQ